MAIVLPDAIAAYFAADRSGDAARVAGCFTAAGVVTDERETHSGRDAIAAWKTSATAKYRYTVEPVSIVAEGARLVVTAHLQGDFPGSPIDLRYGFELEGDRIAALEIVA